MKDKVHLLRERLAKIARQDTSVVIAISNAVVKMTKIGVMPSQIEEWLGEEAARPAVLGDVVYEEAQPWHGFASKQQAVLALMGTRPKKDWPAAFQSAHERVNTLIGNQEPEAQAAAEQQVIIIPGMVVVKESLPAAKTFRRLRSGKLREIKEKEEVEVEEVVEQPAESFIVKAAK